MDCRCIWNEVTRCWTVRAQVRVGHGKPKAWRIIGHARRVNVRDAKFVTRAGKGSVEGWLEGATWEYRHKLLAEYADYVSWLTSDRTYYQHGLVAGDIVTFGEGALCWLTFGPVNSFGTVEPDRITFAHMAVLTAGLRRETPLIRAFDPCHMPA